MSDTAKIEITLYKPNHKPAIGEVINFITKSGEHCLGIYDGRDEWVDWSNPHASGRHETIDIDWWWHLPKVPKEEVKVKP